VSLSLSDLQKQTDKELEKWKKDRPNSTFDPRGRCYGYRMAWEGVQDKQKEHEKKERQKGSLIIPLMRSHSSLSPSVLRKKWRKRSSKTDTEEWDGGGRKFSRSLVEESDEEEMRRKSVCGVVGEQRDKRDRLADELCTHKHKDRNTHPNISVVVSSSIDSDVFEKEHEEASLNQQKDNSATTQEDEKERCVVEETHHHEQITNQDEPSKETQGHQDEQNIEKDRGQDEQTVEEKTLEPEESSPVETSQEEDIQTVFSKQEEETQPDSNIQEVEIQTEHCERQEETENRLPIVIIPEDNLQNEDSIPEKEVQIHVVQDKTSSDQQENSERQKEKDLYMHTPTEEEEEPGEKHEGFQQEEFNVLPEEEIKEAKEITEPSKMCEEKDDKR